MTSCSDVADYHWLTSEEAAVELRDFSASRLPLHTALDHLRRRLSPQRARLVAEQVDLRRRAAAKFASADRMFFTRSALEQATDEYVARYKAARFARCCGGNSDRGTPPLADFCCGIGGDLLALAKLGAVLAVDRNPIATHFAAANLQQASPGAEAQFETADAALTFLDANTIWHIDPDRRHSGRRTTSLDAMEPGLHTIERMLSSAPHAAMKLAPATRLPGTWAKSCEREWIGRDGECRQQVAWHGDLAESPGEHRATVIRASLQSATFAGDEILAVDGTAAHFTIAGRPEEQAAIVDRPARYIFDVDPAIRAAHLTGTLAAMHNLSALAAGSTYLTGDVPICSPAAACFRVEELWPMRVSIISKLLRERRIGRLEIKKRGIVIDPEKLRRDLKLRGENGAALLLTKIAGRPTAILARRCDPTC